MFTTNNNSTLRAQSKLRYLNSSKDFLHAVCCGNTRLVKRLITHPGVDPAMDANTAIRDASRMGYEGIVAILLKDKRVDPSAENNDAICDAAAYGNSEVVELLLKHPSVNPAANDNYPIKIAADGHIFVNSHFDVTAMLLKEKQVDPSAEYSVALRYAAEAGNIRTVKLLLEDGRASPRDCASYALHTAIYHREYDVVEALLQDGRVDIFARDNYATILADLDKQLLAMLLKHAKEHGDIHKAKRQYDPEPPGMAKHYFYTPEDMENTEGQDDE